MNIEWAELEKNEISVSEYGEKHQHDSSGSLYLKNCEIEEYWVV